MLRVLLLATPLALMGCAQSGNFFKEAADKGGAVTESTKKQLGEAIDLYCQNVPATVRLSLRQQVNAYAKEGEVQVDCDVGED